eukprot:TRINITY_DN61067_c0_g1_i1.p1 TRINITY_DN61067_c0_g1~~TRINITY_DN61067_c0_g1_i1.p1  ORF type:complete len:672 (+),score=107.88 TRINITY_DN61067_c0_g1_i1:77-2017(+)
MHFGPPRRVASRSPSPQRTHFASPRNTAGKTSPTAFIRSERSCWRVEGAFQQNNLGELRAALDAVSDASRLDGSQALNAARQNLETVQHRQFVHAAISAEISATLKLNKCSSIVQDERRWASVFQALESGRDAFRQCQTTRLHDRGTKLASLISKVLLRWQTAILSKLGNAIEAQDLQLLSTVVHWARTAHLEESPDSSELLEKASLYLACKESFDRALEEKTKAVLDWACDGAEDIGLTCERCDYLRRAREISRQQSGQAITRWAIVVARMGSNRDRLSAAISLGMDMGFSKADLAGAFSSLDDLERVTAIMVHVANSNRGKDMQQLEGTLEWVQARGEPQALNPRCSIAQMLGEVLRDAESTLTAEKRKETVVNNIASTSNRRPTEVIEDMPEHIKEAKELKLSHDASSASAVYRKAVADKALRKAVETGDVRTLIFAISDAKEAAIPSDQIERAQEVLKQKKILQTADAQIQQFTNICQIQEGLESEIKKHFPKGAPKGSCVAQVQARVSSIRAEFEEHSRFIQKPIDFETNSDKVKVEELQRIKQIAALLQQHQHATVHIVGLDGRTQTGRAIELSQARAANVMKQLKLEGCSNLALNKGAGLAPKLDSRNKSVRLVCDMFSVSPELRRSLKSMIAGFSFSM